MIETIKITNVQTIGKVVRSLQEVFPDLDFKKMYNEESVSRLPRKQQYSTPTNGIIITLACPKRRNVIREFCIEGDDARDINLAYKTLEKMGAIENGRRH